MKYQVIKGGVVATNPEAVKRLKAGERDVEDAGWVELAIGDVITDGVAKRGAKRLCELGPERIASLKDNEMIAFTPGPSPVLRQAQDDGMGGGVADG